MSPLVATSLPGNERIWTIRISRQPAVHVVKLLQRFVEPLNRGVDAVVVVVAAVDQMASKFERLLALVVGALGCVKWARRWQHVRKSRSQTGRGHEVDIGGRVRVFERLRLRPPPRSCCLLLCVWRVN